MTAVAVVLGVVALMVLLGVLVMSGSVATARAAAKRRQVLAAQAESEARIQMRTHAALGELYDAARQRYDSSR